MMSPVWKEISNSMFANKAYVFFRVSGSVQFSSQGSIRNPIHELIFTRRRKECYSVVHVDLISIEGMQIRSGDDGDGVDGRHGKFPSSWKMLLPLELPSSNLTCSSYCQRSASAGGILAD